tara:strand:+ start:781 stop:993 length:213 start_codon:yes stop_codon:yes gene_type:complete
MARQKIVNGEIISLTAEEETARDIQEAQALINKQTEKNDETTRENKKTSGKQKLKDLGLDDAEIKAILNS